MANYNWSVGDTTEVGTYAFPSPYGTFDQAGNVWEWNEDTFTGSFRCRRGGAFDSPEADLRASFRYGDPLSTEYYNIGFRLAYIPEPATLSLLALGGLAVLRRR